MKLNIIIPTYNRAESLRKTLLSLATAELPPNFEVEVAVVDNNSTDETRRIVEEMMVHFSNIKLEYVFEEKQGRSFALNKGIKNADGELLSAIDDDEEIDKQWFVEVEKTFRERWEELDFLSGKILPNLEIEPPSWVEPLKVGALCWRDFGDEEWVYDENSPIISGAHGIFKTEVFKEIGFYNEHIGVKGKGFSGGEDNAFYEQLIKNNKRGVYNPKLIMYHYVPAYRLDKSYFRQWLFGIGISRHLADIHDKPIEGKRVFGVPLWMYRTALRGVAAKVKNVFSGDETESLAAENQPLVFAGFFYGRHLQSSWLNKPLQAVAKRFVKSIER